MTPIADALRTAPGTILDGVRGLIKMAGEYHTGVTVMPDQTKETWSLQTIIVTGKGGEEISVQIAHHDKIEQDKVGSFVWLLSKQEGRRSGLKVVNEGTQMLRVSKTGQVHFSAPGSPVPQPAAQQFPPGAVETGLGTPGTTQTGTAGLGSSHPRNSPLETEGGAKEKSAPLTASVDPVQNGAAAQLAAIDEKVLLYKLIRSRVVKGVGEQLPDQDCVDRCTKTIFDNMVLGGPF